MSADAEKVSSWLSTKSYLRFAGKVEENSASPRQVGASLVFTFSELASLCISPSITVRLPAVVASFSLPVSVLLLQPFPLLQRVRE